MREDTIIKFARLFEGRRDAYGHEEGRAELAQGETYEDRVNAHLNGNRPMGVYPLMYTEPEGWIVNWGCVDFDEGDEASWIHANNLHMVLNELEVTSHIERSRSKGYHVWVFAAESVPAHVMRRALLGATQISKGPLKEINPKSEGFWLPRESADTPLKADTDRIGNYVRLPYPHGYGERRVMCEPLTGNTIGLEEFVDYAHACRTSRSELSQLVNLYKEPARPTPIRVFTPSDSNVPAMERISGLTYTVFQNGPLEGMDRSATLWRLSKLMYTDGLTPDEARDLLYDADSRWGKYTDRGNLKELDKMISRIWDEA